MIQTKLIKCFIPDSSAKAYSITHSSLVSKVIELCYVKTSLFTVYVYVLMYCSTGLYAACQMSVCFVLLLVVRTASNLSLFFLSTE